MDQEDGSMASMSNDEPEQPQADQGQGQTEHEEHQGNTEREVAFKLLAAHAMVDGDFYQRLREDPTSAAAELHIMLDKGDLEYLQGVVNWDELDQYAEGVRNALQPERAVRSPLW